MNIEMLLIEFLVFIAIVLPNVTDCAVINAFQTAESKPLSVYETFSDVQILSFHIEENTILASWNIYFAHISDCADRQVSIYIRHGGYPVVNPYNSSFPSNFYVENTTNYYLEREINKNSNLSLNMSNPYPGTYFATFFIKSSSDKIQQQGLVASCDVSLAFVLSYDFEKNVESLLIDVPSSKEMNGSVYYRFLVPDFVNTLSIHISNCSSSDQTAVPCPLSAFFSPLRMPSPSHHDSKVDCSNDYANDSCSMAIEFSSLNQWNYLLIQSSNLSLSFQLEIRTKKCQKESVGSNRTSSNLNSLDSVHASCYDRIYPIKNGKPENFKFSFGSPPDKNTSLTPVFFNVSYHKPTLINFDLDQTLDIGGTLTLDVILFSSEDENSNNATVLACLENGVVPNIQAPNYCSSPILMTLESDKSKMPISSSISIPYPKSGSWNLVLKSFCISSEESNFAKSYVPCKEDSQVYFHIQSNSCVKGKCGEYGSCYSFISGGVIFSACICSGGWRGWGCNDGSHALSDEQLLTSTLLLTLSNLLFIPAISLAIYRRYLTEAVVYTFIMFFSTFYHACDSDVYTFCLMRGSVMQFCDFYASIMAFWVTVIALADLPEYLRSLAHMTGALGIAFGVEYNRTGLWVFIVPFAVSMIIMISSWIHRCRTQKICFPEKERWLIGIIPGIIFAGSGLVLFAFFETKQNYAYIHSAWHAATALSILMLLPPKKNQGGEGVTEVNWKRRGSFKFLQDNETDMLE